MIFFTIEDGLQLDVPMGIGNPGEISEDRFDQATIVFYGIHCRMSSVWGSNAIKRTRRFLRSSLPIGSSNKIDVNFLVNREKQLPLGFDLREDVVIDDVLTDSLFEILHFGKTAEALDFDRDSPPILLGRQEMLSPEVDVHVLRAPLEAERIMRDHPAVLDQRGFDLIVISITRGHHIDPWKLSADRLWFYPTSGQPLLQLFSISWGGLGWKIPAITDFRRTTIRGPAGLTAVFGIGTGVTAEWGPSGLPMRKGLGPVVPSRRQS